MRYEGLFILSNVASTVKRGDKNSFFYTVCKYEKRDKIKRHCIPFFIS